MSLIWGSDNIGKFDVKRIYEIPWGKKEATRSSDRRRNGGFRGVVWPLLEIIDAQPTLVYKHTGAKRLVFPRENSYSVPLIGPLWESRTPWKNVRIQIAEERLSVRSLSRTSGNIPEASSSSTECLEQRVQQEW